VDLANEAFGVLGVGIEEDGTTSISDLFGLSVVDVGSVLEGPEL
jgi:hypothetical protein